MARVAVIGSGAREHALVRALLRGARSGGPRDVVAIPGNAGIAREARCVPSTAGAEALARAAVEIRPDLVLIDLNLAQCSGFEVLRALRQPGENSAVPAAILRRMPKAFCLSSSICLFTSKK